MLYNQSKYFAAGVFFGQMAGVSQVFAVWSRRKPEYKFPGGCSNEGENPVDCLIREIWEELSVEVRHAENVFPDNGFQRPLGDNHHEQHFFLIRKYNGRLQNGSFLDDNEPKIGAWVSLEEFWRNAFTSHRAAFYHALRFQSSIDADFKRQNRDFVRFLER